MKNIKQIVRGQEKSEEIENPEDIKDEDGLYVNEDVITGHEYGRHEHEGLVLNQSRLLELFNEFREAEQKSARKHKVIYRLICRGILELIRRRGPLKSKEAYDSIAEWLNQDSSNLLNFIETIHSNGPSSNV